MNEGFDHLPKEYRDLAVRLRNGSRNVYREVKSRNLIVAARRRDMKRSELWINPSLSYRAFVVWEAFKKAAQAATASIVRDVQQYQAIERQPEELEEAQLPDVAALVCSDSRVQAMSLLDASVGEIFIHKNVGASVTRHDNYEALTDDAREHITYARDLGIKTMVVFSHGRCGCIANCLHGGKPHVQGELTEDHERVYQRMMGRKEHTVRLVEDAGGAEAFLTALGFDPSKYKDPMLLAMEIADASHTVNLVQNHLRSITPKGQEVMMQVIHVHVALRDNFNLYMFDPVNGRHVKITDYPPFNRPVPANDVRGGVRGIRKLAGLLAAFKL